MHNEDYKADLYYNVDTFVDRYFNVDNFEEAISGGVSNSMRIINYFEVILFY